MQHIATQCYKLQQPATMSSNIRISRICQLCGNEFEARKTTSKTCSDRCAKLLYKQRQKLVNIEKSHTETKELKAKPLEEVKAKEYLSIADTCKLLGISRWTVWRSIKRNELRTNKIGKRTIIKRSEINKLLA